MKTMLTLYAVIALGLGSSDDPKAAVMSSVAIRVHHTQAMLSFYSEAFGVDFQMVQIYGLTVYEGTLGTTVFKLVPMREQTDFSGFPVHQLGFTVRNIEDVIRVAEEHGGRLLERRAATAESPQLVAIRDPDGNSIELYAHR